MSSGLIDGILLVDGQDDHGNDGGEGGVEGEKVDGVGESHVFSVSKDVRQMA